MKVIIIGGLSKRRNFPNSLPGQSDVEVWGMNAIRPGWVPRWDRMFNLHTYENLIKYRWHKFDQEADWSDDNPHVPFYTIDSWPREHALAGWRPFPGEQMMHEMHRGYYHCSSFDWLVALAMWFRNGDDVDYPYVTEIELHGVALNMEAGEPISGRACLEYWCGRAEGAGIKITLADDAKLFDFYHIVRSKLVYGYDDTPVVEDALEGEVESRLAGKPAPYGYEE